MIFIQGLALELTTRLSPLSVLNVWSNYCTVHVSMDIYEVTVQTVYPVAYPGILFGGGGSTNSVEDRGQTERGSVGGSPLVRGSGGSCNLVQEISFRVVKFSYFLVL